MKYAAAIILIAITYICYSCCIMSGNVDRWDEIYFRKDKEDDNGG